jgi:GH18 family chitinase
LDKCYDLPKEKEIIGYYPVWGIYGRGIRPKDLPFGKYKTINIAFMVICGDNPNAFNGGIGLQNECAATYYSGPFEGSGPRKKDEVWFDDSWAMWMI